ncbi:MAG: LysR family transcriptional regulator [Sneathiella sp.]
MSLKNIDLNLFVLFEVIYDAGNLTQASHILNVTQPAVSNALARLRAQVGDPLFVHSGKRMNPTATADELIGPVRQALRLLQGTVDREPLFEPSESKKVIRLSIGDVGEAIILPRFAQILQVEAPQMKISVYQVERKLIGKKLAANEIDFAIDIPTTVEGQLMQVSLTSDQQVCVVAPNHALASNLELSLEDYLACNHIHVSSRKKGGGVADLGLGKLGVSRNILVRLQHYQAAFALLENSNLLLTAPKSLAGLYPCKSFELPFVTPNLDLSLYWHKSTERSGVNNWVRAKLQEATLGSSCV